MGKNSCFHGIQLCLEWPSGLIYYTHASKTICVDFKQPSLMSGICPGFASWAWVGRSKEDWGWRVWDLDHQAYMLLDMHDADDICFCSRSLCVILVLFSISIVLSVKEWIENVVSPRCWWMWDVLSECSDLCGHVHLHLVGKHLHAAESMLGANPILAFGLPTSPRRQIHGQ